MFKKTIFFTIIIYLFNSNILIALEPDIFVQSTVNRASSILSENITKDEKINKLKKIAKETVDIKGIGFYTLGPTRKTLNQSQKTEYVNLIEQYFLKSFSRV